MKTIRIFISSPGDVAEEREKAKQVIASLEQRYDGDVQLIPVLWEELAIPATASFQEGIDFLITAKHRIDIAVFVLWSRLGTPLGPAIRKPDGTPYLSGTEREFDVMLAAFKKSEGRFPFILAYTRRDDEGFTNRLDATKHGDDALQELINQRILAKQFIQENFHDKEGHNLRAYYSYRQPNSFAEHLEGHLRQAVDDLLSLDLTAPTWHEAPYRSLEVFDIRHAPIFCGRYEETCDALQRLRDQKEKGCSFVCIVGASGSGKSSLARAGIAAKLLNRSFEDAVKEWRAAIFLSSLASGDLFLGLARNLAEALPELRSGIGGLERFAKTLEEQNSEAAGILLETAFKTAGEKAKGPVCLLLVFDQMEELWTDHGNTPAHREKFLQTIEFLARNQSISVLATLRSDFYPQAQLSETFLRMKAGGGHFDLTPPGTASLRELIVQPALRSGLRFERDERTGRTLDQRILEDAAHDPSALPLLQYALAELYERRDEKQRLLTFSAYEKMGGVEGALGQRAAQTFDGLPDETKAVFNEVLPLLISVEISGEQNTVRRRSPLADLSCTPARRQLTERLIHARFLTTDDQSGVPIAALAHEALLRRWDRVAAWISTNRDFLFARSHIEQNAAIWKLKGFDPGYLLPSGKSLEEAEDIANQKQTTLSPNAQAYVQASIVAVQEIAAEKRREQKRAALRKCNEAQAVWADYQATGFQHPDEWRFSRLAEIETLLVDALSLDPELADCATLLGGIRRLLVEAGIKTKDLNLASIYLQKLKTMSGAGSAPPPELGQNLNQAWAEADPARNKCVLAARKWAMRGIWMPLIWLVVACCVGASFLSAPWVVYLLISGTACAFMHLVEAIFTMMMVNGEQAAAKNGYSFSAVNLMMSVAALNLVSLGISIMIHKSLDDVRLEKLFWPKPSVKTKKPIK